MRTGLYIHYPFCLKKCLYCDFNSSASSPVSPEEYVAAVVREMELRREFLPAPVAAPTLYLGGGTPSLMSPQLVGCLIDAASRHFGLEGDAEITVEANPGTLTSGKLSGYRAAGVNRLSLGIQSFEDRLLQRLGRVHSAQEAVQGFESARRAGFDNISIDLMHSLPEQSVDQWRQALREAVVLAPEHISAYALSVEEGTPFSGLQAAGKLPLPAEESAAQMFEETIEILAAAGYLHYEISNFARPGRFSRHNSAYWSRQSYLGFGAGAHSLWNPSISPPLAGEGEGAGEGAEPSAQNREGGFPCPGIEGERVRAGADPTPRKMSEAGLDGGVDGGGRRWSNACGVQEYTAAVLAGSMPEEDSEVLSVEDAVSESFFLGLRVLSGIDLARLEAQYGKKPLERHLAEVASLEAGGALVREGSVVRLAPSAVILANTVFSRFV